MMMGYFSCHSGLEARKALIPLTFLLSNATTLGSRAPSPFSLPSLSIIPLNFFSHLARTFSISLCCGSHPEGEEVQWDDRQGWQGE